MLSHNIPNIGISPETMRLLLAASNSVHPLVVIDNNFNNPLKKHIEDRNELGLTEKEMIKLRKIITTPVKSTKKEEKNVRKRK